jgi:hypothetical protein
MPPQEAAVMSRRLFACPLAALALATGCLKDTRKDTIKPLPADPTSARGAAPARPRLPSPIARDASPKSDELPPVPSTAPIVRLPSAGAEPAAAPPLLAPPVAPAADDGGDKARRSPAEEKPAKPAEAADPRTLYKRAADRFAKLPDYEARLVRREAVTGKVGPTEEILFRFRKTPFSVSMKNTGDAGRGREVLYVKGKFEGKMHVVVGEGDGGLFARPGSKMAFEPDSPLVASKSRHKITEAGFGATLERLAKLLDPGRATPLGSVSRKEYPYPLDGVELALKPGDDPGLPAGGKQLMFFDPNPESEGYALPVLSVVSDPAGHEVEYYCFDRFHAPAKLIDADFDPERMGKKK